VSGGFVGGSLCAVVGAGLPALGAPLIGASGLLGAGRELGAPLVGAVVTVEEAPVDDGVVAASADVEPVVVAVGVGVGSEIVSESISNGNSGTSPASRPPMALIQTGALRSNCLRLFVDVDS
jgi:hypothetical protein